MSSKVALVGPLVGHRRGVQGAACCQGQFCRPSPRDPICWGLEDAHGQAHMVCNDQPPWTTWHVYSDAEKPRRAFGTHGDTKSHGAQRLGVWRGASVTMRPGLQCGETPGCRGRVGGTTEAGRARPGKPSLLSSSPAGLAWLSLHLFPEPSLRQPLLAKGTSPGHALARAVLLSHCPSWT